MQLRSVYLKMCHISEISGSWHALVTGTWWRSRTWVSAFLSREEGRAAGWGNLVPSYLCWALWSDHTEQGHSAPLSWCWLQTGTHGICPEDAQVCEMWPLRGKNPTHSNPQKNPQEKIQKGSLHLHCLSSRAKAKRQGRARRQGSSAWAFRRGLALPCPVVLVLAAAPERTTDNFGQG